MKIKAAYLASGIVDWIYQSCTIAALFLGRTVMLGSDATGHMPIGSTVCNAHIGSQLEKRT